MRNPLKFEAHASPPASGNATMPPIGIDRAPLLLRAVGLERLAVGIITIGAAAVRLYRIGNWSFWIDEVLQIRDSLAMGVTESILSGHYPLFYLLEKPFLHILGTDEWSARIFPAMIGVLSIPIIYLIVRPKLGAGVAVLSAVLLAISPWHLYWSQNARFYTQLLILLTLALFSFHHAVETDRFRYLLGSLAVWVLAISTHSSALLMAPVVILYFLSLRVLGWEQPKGFRLRNLTPFVLLPLIGLSLYDLYRAVFEGRDSFITSFISVFVGQPNHTAFSILETVAYHVGIPLAVLAVVGGLQVLRERDRLGLLLALAVTIPLFSIMALSPLTFTAFRYAFAYLPAWVILAGIAVRSILQRGGEGWAAVWWVAGTGLLLVADHVLEDLAYYLGEPWRIGALVGFGLLAILLMASKADFSAIRQARGYRPLLLGMGILLPILAHAIIADTLYFRFQHGHRDDWRAATALIRSQKMAGDIVVSTLPPLATHYMGEQTWHLEDLDLDAEIRNGARIWLIEDWGVYKFFGDFEAWTRAHCQLLEEYDNYAAGRNFQFRVHHCDAS